MPVTNYIWDVVSDNVLMEKDDDDETIARYVQEPSLYGEAISQERDGQTRYYHYDGEGNTSELTDEDQNVTDTYEYSAFGEDVARTGTTENPFGYKGSQGYYANPETDDHYVRERPYQPAVGRWLAQDRLRFVDGVNMYVYVHNRPVMGADPSGMLTESLVGDPKLQSCAAYLVVFQWQLDATERDGVIIQAVQVGGSAEACDEKKSITEEIHCPLPISCGNGTNCNAGQGYFELWNVRGGRILVGARDTFGFGGYSIPTRGSVRKQGSAVFIHLSSMSERDKKVIDDHFKTGAKGVAAACDLPSTCWVDPVLQLVQRHNGGFSNSRITVKSVTKEWDCCCPCPPSEVKLHLKYNVKTVPLGQPNAGDLSMDEWSDSGQRSECKDC